MSKKVLILVRPDGSTKIETKGFSGSSCKAASGPYERALGVVSNDVHTAEYFQQAEGENQAQTGQW